MRFVGVDIATVKHVVAAMDDTGAVILKATVFAVDAGGYSSCSS